MWLGAAAALVAMVALLTVAVRFNPVSSQDIRVLDWVAGWDFPGLSGALGVLSFLTSAKAGAVYGPAAVAVLLYVRKVRAALAFAAVGLVVAAVAVLGDYTLGEVVGRPRPLEESGTSFPSGHVFGTVVLFGFAGFLAVRHGLRRRFLVPGSVLIAGLILAVGPARVHEQAHWPSDVAAGYLVGGLWLLLIIGAYPYIQKLERVVAPGRSKGLSSLPGEGLRVERSIASVVLLDPRQGTATKTYRPPAVVRLIYWLAFQARFPYTNNPSALQAAVYRRKIAGMLTRHRFGKDLVAPAIGVEYTGGEYSFVTEFVQGELARNDERPQRFLSQVAELFASAGLSVWQINPRNPHAHTNLIDTPEGDFKIIDLESAIPTPFPAPGNWRSALKRGSYPVFDDMDFPRLRGYASENRAALEASLGVDGLAELDGAVDRCEQLVNAWKESEPRIWGRISRLLYRLMDWKGFFQGIERKMEGADRAALGFLDRGIDRWQEQGRLTSEQVAALRSRLASSEVRDAMHHLGAHLVLSALLRFPFGSVVRPAWVVAFWVSARVKGVGHGSPGSLGPGYDVHTPLVMVLSVVPGFGGVAYMASRPLRNKMLVRLVLDQTASKLPFGLYRRMRLARLIAPAGDDTRKQGAYRPPSAEPVSWEPAPCFAGDCAD